MWSLTQMVTSLIFFQANLEDFFTINWNQQYSQFNLVIKVGKNNELTIFSIQLCLSRYFSQRDMVINFLWKEILVGKEMAMLAKKCCFSNPLMRSDDLSLFESFGLLYQRKCIIPWSCINFFFQSHIYKTQYNLKRTNSKLSGYSVPNGQHQQGRLEDLLPSHFKRWDFTLSGISRCRLPRSLSERSLTGDGIWKVLTESPQRCCLEYSFLSIWWEKDEKKKP